MLSQKSLRWRRVLSPRKASLPHEDWVLRGLTLHQLKDIITDIYASKVKADARSEPSPTPVNPLADKVDCISRLRKLYCNTCLSSWTCSQRTISAKPGLIAGKVSNAPSVSCVSGAASGVTFVSNHCKSCLDSFLYWQTHDCC